MENNPEFLFRAAHHLAKSESMRGKKPTHRIPRAKIIQIHDQQHSYEKHCQSTVPLEMITSLIYKPCTQPLSSLQRISLTDLVIEIVHRGKYLLLRTIIQPKKIVEIKTIVEDPEGNVEVFELYNQNPDRSHKDVIPNDSIIILKEPYYKISPGGGTALRCDHPTDLIFLDTNDILVQTINWKTETPKIHKIQTAAEYKTLGNDCFKQGKFYEAIKAYSDGISSLGTSDPEISVLKLNRSQTYLKVHHFEAALNDSFYGLESYDEALVQIKKLLETDPGNVDGKKELTSIMTRIEEKEKGIYNFDQMLKEAKKSSTPRLDYASYVGPVQLTEIAERGRGLVLTEDVRKGQLILCTKAFAITYPTECSEVHFNAEVKLVETGDHVVNTARAINKLQNNPSLSSSFFQLYAGQHRIGETSSTIISETIDSFWVSDICSMNTFDVSQDESSINENAAGLFLLPSFINHVCCENVIRSYIGDMMIVRAAYDLAQGTELFLTYAGILLPYEERTKALEKHKFICNCTLCNLDRAETVTIREKRRLLLDKYQQEYRFLMLQENFHNPTKAIGEMLKMMTDIENTYKESGRERYRFGLIEPLLALGKMYGDTNDTENAFKSYKKLLEIHEFGLSTNTGLVSPFLYQGIIGLLRLYYRTSQIDKAQHLLKLLCQSLVVTPTGDDRIFVEENRKDLARLFGV
ncbi:hypothetical protein I4U23_027045 [Adineta vaga]|nr:hypothetical protein I4U23_027045 [Adineta vaga]